MDWSMMAWIFFAVFLFVLSAILFAVEIFVPSFGLLSVCAIACLVGGGAIFFKFGTSAAPSVLSRRWWWCP